MITGKIKQKIDSVVIFSRDYMEESWAKNNFQKPVFKEKHLAPKTNRVILEFESEVNCFILFAGKFIKENPNEKEYINSITFNDYIEKYRDNFIKTLTIDEVKQCGQSNGGVYLLLRSVTDVIHKFNVPKHVVINCNEFMDEFMKLNYIQVKIIKEMFNHWDYNWTLSNFFTQPDNISKGEKPTAYAHFFQELTEEERKENLLTMKDYINLNLKSVDYNTFMNHGPFKSIPSQMASYHLGNRGEGLVESAVFSEVSVYSTALQLGVEAATPLFINLSETLEEYNKTHNINRRSASEKAYKKISIPQYIIDSIIIDENRNMPLEWAVELHMDELKEEVLNDYLKIINS